jgi:hypothetical protein
MLGSTICDASARPGERTISIGVTMSRRPGSFLMTLFGIGVAGLFVAACGEAITTPSPTAQATPGPTATATGSSTPSGSVVPSPSPVPTADVGLPHVNAALEDNLPETIGGVDLSKLSMPLSTFIASYKAGANVLYTPWLVKFGKTPDEIDIAVASDLLQTENFVVQAIQVPGVDAASLLGEFAAVARQNKWPVTPPKTIGPKSVLEIMDPATNAAGGLGTAYVYANADVLYLVVTDDPSLLLEALIKLPPVPAA